MIFSGVYIMQNIKVVEGEGGRGCKAAVNDMKNKVQEERKGDTWLIFKYRVTGPSLSFIIFFLYF